MNRYLFPVIIAALLFQVSPAFSDITWKATASYMHPYNREARKISGGDWGLSGEMEFHLEGIPDFISWAGGIDWVDMLGERSTYLDSYGVPYTHELDQIYVRFWFGPRLRSHLDAPFRPYAGVNVSLIFYEYSSFLYLFPGDERFFIADDWELVLGYGADAGLEIRTASDWSIDLGVKYLGTFGEPRQLSFDSVTVHPSYLLYYLGVRFPMWEGL
jgi:hypothetical protein